MFEYIVYGAHIDSKAVKIGTIKSNDFRKLQQIAMEYTIKYPYTILKDKNSDEILILNNYEEE